MTTMKYTREHEWLRAEDDGEVVIGITNYAQDQLGDIVYVELPDVGSEFTEGERMVVIESVKAVGEINVPIAGSVAAVNSSLVDEPEVVNSDPLGRGWLIRVKPQDIRVLDDLLEEGDYQTYVESL